MFSFENIAVKITSVTNVAEMKGKERVPAITFGVRIVGPSTLLNQFDADLRGFLFKKSERRDELPLGDEGLYEQRFPEMGAIPWNKEYAGYQVLFPIGATGTEDVLLNDVGFKGFIFSTMEGGSCAIDFKGHAKPDSEKDHGKIARLLQTETTATFAPPEITPDLVDAMQVYADETKPKRGRKAAVVPDYEDQFAGSDLEGGAE